MRSGQAKSLGEHSGKREEYEHRVVKTSAGTWLSSSGVASGTQQACRGGPRQGQNQGLVEESGLDPPDTEAAEVV